VQCSVCGAAFDAHLGLLMEDGSPVPLIEPEPVEAPPPAIAPPPEAASDEATADLQGEAELAESETVGDGVSPVPQGIAQREARSICPPLFSSTLTRPTRKTSARCRTFRRPPILP